MSGWRQVSMREVERIIAAGLLDCSPAQRHLFDSIRVAMRPVPIERLGRMEEVLVVAAIDGAVLFWDDVEEGFELANPGADGVLRSCSCNQFELKHVLARLLKERRPAGAAVARETIGTYFEFHDSVLQRVSSLSDGTVELDFDASVHSWNFSQTPPIGTGMTAPVRLSVAHAEHSESPPAAPVGVAGGTLRVANDVWGEIVPMPLDRHGPAELTLELESGETSVVTGDAATLRLTGKAKRLEDLPQEFRPDEAR